jgi:primase-polymerase (primpol)-like protein
MNVDLTKIPPTMREIPLWLVWRIETDEKGRPTKVPYIAGSRRHASSTDPDTWTSLEEAVAGAAGADGIGFAIQDSGVVFIDLDHCIANGEIATWAKQIVHELASFTEVSPSGTGLHVYTAGNLPSGPRVKALDGGARIEFYDAGRYTTVSTVHLKGTPHDIVACSRLAEIYGRVVAREPRAPRVPQTINQGRAHAVASTIDAQNWMRRFGIEVLSSGPYGDGTKYVIACPGSHGDYDPAMAKRSSSNSRAEGSAPDACIHRAR